LPVSGDDPDWEFAVSAPRHPTDMIGGANGKKARGDATRYLSCTRVLLALF
jgi:hypothetical protein